MATIDQLRTGLAATTVPDDIALALIAGASPLWLSSDSGAQLAEDLALCHPPLKRAEVRARAVAAEDGWRLAVVAHDRHGLLADTAAILAAANYSVRAASVATWNELDLALHAINVSGPPPSDAELDELGAALRAASNGTRPSAEFAPAGRAFVRRTGEANGDAMISVVAPDQTGLLAAICAWFAETGTSIEAAWITGEGEANDVFVVTGDVDVAALERRLTADGEGASITDVAGDMFAQARDVGEGLVRTATDFVKGLFGRK
jgi:predicted amino acid-binding ACT domain protein